MHDYIFYMGIEDGVSSHQVRENILRRFRMEEAKKREDKQAVFRSSDGSMGIQGSYHGRGVEGAKDATPAQVAKAIKDENP